MDDAEVLRALGALAQPHRLRCFRALVVAGAGGLTPGRMAAQLAIAPATLSFHLKALVHAGLVSQTRAGRHQVYRAAFARMHAVLGYLSANCCAGQACELDATTTLTCPC